MPTPICQSDTLRLLVRPMSDEQVVAVSGHAKVGNLRTFIARCQALEYTCGFNLDRRAYDRWNCITVVPGAISAMRHSAIERAGRAQPRYAGRGHRSHARFAQGKARIVYTPDAIAWTEAPETVAHARTATFPLGLRHLAMSLETSRHGLQLALPRARLVQPAERLVFPNPARRAHAAGRSSFSSLRFPSAPGARSCRS